MIRNRVLLFLYAQTAWMLLLLLTLVLVDALAYDFFIITSFLGMWVLVELVTPLQVSPQWTRRMKRLIVPSLLVSVYLIGQWILRMISTAGI